MLSISEHRKWSRMNNEYLVLQLQVDKTSILFHQSLPCTQTSNIMFFSLYMFLFLLFFHVQPQSSHATTSLKYYKFTVIFFQHHSGQISTNITYSLRHTLMFFSSLTVLHMHGFWFAPCLHHFVSMSFQFSHAPPLFVSEVLLC